MAFANPRSHTQSNEEIKIEKLTLETEAANLHSVIAGLKKQKSTHKDISDQITEKEAQLKSLHAEITKKEIDHKTTNSALEVLLDAVTKKQAEKMALETEMKNRQKRITELEAEEVGLKEKIKQAIDIKNTLEASITELEDKKVVHEELHVKNTVEHNNLVETISEKRVLLDSLNGEILTSQKAKDILEKEAEDLKKITIEVKQELAVQQNKVLEATNQATEILKNTQIQIDRERTEMLADFATKQMFLEQKEGEASLLKNKSERMVAKVKLWRSELQEWHGKPLPPIEDID